MMIPELNKLDHVLMKKFSMNRILDCTCIVM